MSWKPCKQCGQRVSGAATVCPHCGKEQGAGKEVGCLIAVCIFVLVAIVGALFEEKKGAPERESTPPPQLFMPGDIARVSTAEPFLMPLTKDAREEEAKLSAAHDQLGLRKMVLDGKAVTVAGGTQVRILGVNGILQVTCEVRLLEGKYLGESGWIEAEFLRKQQ